MPKGDQLTVKQQGFVNAIISGMDNIDAYKKAYPTSRKWKGVSISVAASKLRKHPIVAAQVAEGLREARERAVLTRQRALEILSQQAEGTIGDLIDDDGNLVIDKIKKAGASVKSIQTTITTTENGEQVTHKVQISGQKEAIDSLARLENWNKETRLGEAENVILNLNLFPSRNK